ncbi:MAG: methyltransferase domain-containing protein [Proteobacteria bacterium]|nr:MAG: methyltransferase domain-containing protein [Pseudomonadota bacterium]
MKVQDREEKSAWQERWQKGRTAWDQGRPHPSLSLLVEHARREGGLVDGARFYSAGAGRAHSEAALAAQGFQVDAVDLSPEAIAIAQGDYGHLTNLNLRAADIFDIPDEERGVYDAVYDRAMLCALSPDVQPSYVEVMTARLKVGGLFCGILFRSVEIASPPPYPVDEAEAMKLFAENFQLCFARAIPLSPQHPAIKEEWICVWRRRGHA